jgi:hypothetical protein
MLRRSNMADAGFAGQDVGEIKAQRYKPSRRKGREGGRRIVATERLGQELVGPRMFGTMALKEGRVPSRRFT